jgi:hypothetical protein
MNILIVTTKHIRLHKAQRNTAGEGERSLKLTVGISGQSACPSDDFGGRSYGPESVRIPMASER